MHPLHLALHHRDGWPRTRPAPAALETRPMHALVSCCVFLRDVLINDFNTGFASGSHGQPIWALFARTIITNVVAGSHPPSRSELSHQHRNWLRLRLRQSVVGSLHCTQLSSISESRTPLPTVTAGFRSHPAISVYNRDVLYLPARSLPRRKLHKTSTSQTGSRFRVGGTQSSHAVSIDMMYPSVPSSSDRPSWPARSSTPPLPLAPLLAMASSSLLLAMAGPMTAWGVTGDAPQLHSDLLASNNPFLLCQTGSVVSLQILRSGLRCKHAAYYYIYTAR